jgi:hypothetical protein
VRACVFSAWIWTVSVDCHCPNVPVVINPPPPPSPLTHTHTHTRARTRTRAHTNIHTQADRVNITPVASAILELLSWAAAVASCAPSDNILSSADDAESGGSRSQIIANALRSRTEHNEPSGAPGVADVGAAAAAAGATGDGSCQRLAWLSAVDTATDRAISEFSQRFAPELHALSLLVGATSLNAPFVNEPLSGGSASVEWAEARVGWSRCMVSVHAERVHTNVQTEGYASTHKNTRARAHTHTHTHTGSLVLPWHSRCAPVTRRGHAVHVSSR